MGERERETIQFKHKTLTWRSKRERETKGGREGGREGTEGQREGGEGEGNIQS